VPVSAKSGRATPRVAGLWRTAEADLALPPQDTHLMSQRDELEFQGGAATKAEAEYGNDGGKDRDHARDVGRRRKNLQPFSVLWSFEQARHVSMLSRRKGPNL
jgi:hypothetical protein